MTGPLSFQCSALVKCRQLTGNIGLIESEILKKFKAFVFDIDGVLLLGSTAVPRGPECLDFLQSLGKSLYVFTNNSAMTPKLIQAKLSNAGYSPLPLANLYSSSTALRCYFESAQYKGRIYMLGSDVMEDVLNDVPNVEVVRGRDHEGQVVGPFQFHEMEAKAGGAEDINAVVMGFDPKLNYYKMAYAHKILADPNTHFVATNKDRLVPVGGQFLPGTGTFINALEYSTGRESITVGKPATYVADEILRGLKDVHASEVCMVGDNLATDIPFGVQSGMGTILVESGVDTVEAARRHSKDQPDFVLSSIADLIHKN